MDTAMPQPMAQAPFFFFQEGSKDARKSAMGLYSMVPTMPTTPIYSRPGSSSCSQPPTLYSNGPSVMTPTASPHPASHGKPVMMLETDVVDNPYFPSTPPLSTSGSTVGSPKHNDLLQTPMNPMFSGLDEESFKASFESVEAAALDWSSCGSPPMTPVYLQSLPSNSASLNANTSFGAASTVSYAKSVSSEQDVDFCDPRNLTVSANAANPTLAPEFAVNALGDEVLKRETIQASAVIQPTFDFNPAVPHGLPSFEELSDLESEDDFVNSFVNLGEQDTEAGRPRACTGSSIVSLGHASFIGDEDLSFEEHSGYSFPSMPSPPSTTVSFSEDSHKDKRVKKSHKKDDCVVAPIMTAAAAAAGEATSNEVEAQSPQDDNDSCSEMNGSSCSEAGSQAMPAPVNRRGRKQSLTEDPSKTFVCDLCHRRFRRQEHLKRHYRSLHTQEKPFECQECGKKFSRSDNLAQHARTHGAGAIVMNLIEEGEASVFDGVMSAPSADDYGTYGKVLFQIAAQAPGSASEMSSDDNSEQGKKKRKRSE